MGRARALRPLTLDAGALIALDAGDQAVRETIRVAMLQGARIAIPAGALAQVWRDGRRQAALARLIRQPGTRVEAMTGRVAKAAGELCGLTGTRDVVDASVVVCARSRPGCRVLTSDPGDLHRLDARLAVERV